MVHNGTSHGWVTNKFKAHTMEDGKKEQFVTFDRQNYTHASEYFASFRLGGVSLPQRAGAGPTMTKQPVLFLNHSKIGAQVWWSVPALLQKWGLLPEKEPDPGRATHNHRMHSWERLAERCGLDTRCLRKASVTGHLDKDSKERQNKDRVWQVPSMATHLVIRYLSRSAFARDGCGRLKSPSQRQSAEDALNSFLQVFKGNSLHRILVGPNAVWHPPHRPQADRSVLINCATHRVDFKSILDAFPNWKALQACQKVASFKWEDCREVDIIVLLQSAELAGSEAEGFLNQLVWGIGTAIEDVLVPELLQRFAEEEPDIVMDSCDTELLGEPAGSEPLEQPRQQPAHSSTSNHTSTGSDSNVAVFRTEAGSEESTSAKVEQFLDSYHRGAKRIFKDELQLSMSIDATRMAKKQLILAAVAAPTGEAAWAPPQISNDYVGEATLAILECADDEEADLEAAKEDRASA